MSSMGEVVIALSMAREETSDKKEVTSGGLSSDEARERLKKYGPNALPEKPPPSDLAILIDQIKNPLVYILFAAGIVTFLLHEITDTTIIAVAVITNTLLSFIQERKASRALFALKKMIHPTAKVIRDGQEKELDVAEVVPGDVCILNQGDKIPADGSLVEANRMFVDEAMLTGESVPVGKLVPSHQSSDIGRDKKEEIKSEVQSPKSNGQVFMGTIVSSGNGKMLVERTGEETEIGKIAESVQEVAEDTPLKKQLKKFSKQLTVLVIVLVVFVFSIGLLKSSDIFSLFETSVALAVSSIPEGILVGLTIVLAIGMQRILKKKGLVRHLISAETLGGVTTICIDKTGTLTQGKMQAVDFLGNERDIALQMILANDHDDPLVIAGFEWARQKLTHLDGQATRGLETGKVLEKYDRIDSIPFTSERRFFASLHKGDPSLTHSEQRSNVIFVNGAPELILDGTTLDISKKAEITKQIEKFTNEGKRVIGLARKRVKSGKKKLKVSDCESDLEWVGILAFTDPIRAGVKDAFVKTKKAGINLIVITGDYPGTAISVMNHLNMHTCKKCMLLGDELKKLDAKSLPQKLSGEHRVTLFARTTPQQKLKIVEALKENGEVVAMMGDGVNDAPALNKADIGIVVGEATEVAKESADLVLLDSSFATIVSAIEEGRGIFDNVRKIILYLMSDSFEEILAVVGTIILGLPLPVTAAQILWINLVSDGFPDMALTIDPKMKGIMERRPRDPKEGLVSNWMKELIGIVSLAGGIMALLVFIYFYKTTGDLSLAQSVTFVTLGVNSLVYVYSVRTLTEPFWREKPFENIWLNISVIAGFVLQVIPFMSRRLRSFFGVVLLTPIQWVVVFSASVIMFIIIEVTKHLFDERLEVR